MSEKIPISGADLTTLQLGDQVAIYRPGQAEGEKFRAAIGSTVRAADGTALLVGGCALRNSGGGWAAIDDASHHPFGIGAVSQSATAVTVQWDQTYKRVGATIVSADETFAGIIAAGPSVGLSNVSFNFRRVVSMGGYVYYNGASWDYTTIAGDLIIGASWVSNALRVKFQHGLDGRGTNKAQVCSRSATYRAYIDGGGETGTDTYVDIRFVDTDGVAITTPDTGMKVRVNVPNGGGLIDPSKITTAWAPLSNIWVMSLMEPLDP